MSSRLLARPSGRLAGVIAFGIAYYGLSKLGLSLVAHPAQVAVMWPASGLALGVVVLTPRRWWPALATAIFVSNLMAQALARGVHPTSATLALINALEPLLAAFVLIRVVGGAGRVGENSLRSVGGLLAAAGMANAVTAALAATALHVGVGAPLQPAFSGWYLADGLGMLAVAPLVLALAHRDARRPGLEDLALGLLTSAAAIGIFAFPAEVIPAFLAYPYIIFPLLSLTAVRCGRRTTAFTSLAIATIATLGTLAGQGTFARPDLTQLESVTVLQGFLGVVAVLTLALAGMLSKHLAVEARLSATSERFASVLSAATEFSVIGTDLAGTITVFNVGAERMLGYSAAEMVGLQTPAAIHDPLEVLRRAEELSMEPGFDVFVHTARDGEAETREWTYVRKDGATLRVSLTVTAMLDDAGRVVGYIGIARDVTDTAKAEEERAALVRVSRAVAANTEPDELWALVAREVGLLHHATAAGITRFEPGAVGTVVGAWSEEGWLTAGTRVDLSGDTATAMVSRSGRFEMQHYSGESPQNFVRGLADDHGLSLGVGSPIIVEGELWGAVTLAAHEDRALLDDAGRGLGRFAELAGLAIANAEHRDRLKRTGDELAAIIDGLPALVWVSDGLGGVVLANEAFHETTRAPAATADPLGQTFDLADENLAAEAMRARETVRTEQTVCDAGGRERTFLVARSPLASRTGEIYALCCVATDITDRHEVERAKDEFVSVVSHELRTPLSSIRGALSLLAEEDDELPPAAARRMLDIALSNSERLVRLISDILDLQRISSGAASLDVESCDGATLASEAAEAMSSFALEREVRIELATRPLPIRADPDRVMQILNNLLSNAIKFSPCGSPVTIGTAVVDGEACFFVRDLGRGIPADKLESIFGRFQQVDSSDSRNVGGTGLGLAICREIAGQHGGRVWAESEEGRGSCFWVALPDSPADAPPAPAQPAPGFVLICDDDAEDRARARSVVEALGLRVMEAENGATAVRMARAARPAAVLLDLVMPGMDGLETLAALGREDATKDVPIIMVSELARGAEPMPAPMREWITKPFEADRLVGAIAGAALSAGASQILVVEDDEDLAEVVTAGMRADGRIVRHARTGAQAVEMATQIRPDLVVLDVGLPDRDGFSVVEELRAQRIEPGAVIVYTGMDLDDAARERLRLGRTEFLTKSVVAPRELHQHMTRLLAASGGPPSDAQA